MKKTLLVIIILFFTTNISFSKEKSCQGIKKLSKAFLACKADSIKKGTVKKAGNLKKGVKKLGSGLAKPFKKKD